MAPTVLLATLLAVALLVAAGLKAVDRTATAVAAGTFGLQGRAARWIWLPLAGSEALLAVALLAGWGPAAWAAVAMLGAFAAAQATAIAAGRAGAPCGCFGAHGSISWGSVIRTASLAAAAALLGFVAVAVPVELRAGGAAAAIVVAAVVVARVRRAGIPDGALEIAGEGPPLGSRLELGEDPRPDSPLALAGHSPEDPRLAFFSSPSCRLCRALAEPARALGATIFDEVDNPRAWSDAAVPGAPYAVVLAADGTVLAKGTVNTRRQLMSVLAAGRARGGAALPEQTAGLAAGRARGGAAVPEQPAATRRTFLATASAAIGAVVATRTLGSLLDPAAADAHHFCGHIYTTDSCPHPTGLPRVDSRGYPLRARDGHPIDDLGRPIDAQGAPLDKDGRPLLDPDGRPMPATSRTRVCTAVGRRFDIKTRIDGSWSRCCDGHVRRLTDCCSTSSRRINGDRALRGYCYDGRTVFCVIYHQTKIKC